MIDIVKILEKRYPKHTFALEKVFTSPDQSIIREAILCDGKPMRLTWSPTAVNELERFHEINAADLLVTSITELVGRVLDEEAIEDDKTDKQIEKEIQKHVKLSKEQQEEVQKKIIEKLSRKELIKRGLV